MGDLDAHWGPRRPAFIKETRMRLMTMCSAMVIALTVGVGQAVAQTRYDVGLVLGATRTSEEGAALAFDRATTYQATFAWRAWEGSKVAVSLEVPFLASPAFTVATAGGSLPKEYAALYLTPGVRLTVNPNGLVSVFGSVGWRLRSVFRIEGARQRQP